MVGKYCFQLYLPNYWYNITYGCMDKNILEGILGSLNNITFTYK